MKHRRGLDLTPRSNVITLPQRQEPVTSQHHYFVEVWSDLPDQGGSFLETISIATEFYVSMAAYREAMRRRPGKVLVHFNGQHQMAAERAAEQPPPLG